MGSGPLTGGSTLSLELTQGPSNALTLLWISTTSTPIVVFDGTVHAFPFDAELLLSTNGSGEFLGSSRFPSVVPPGFEMWFQFLLHDTSVVFGLTLSNAVMAVTP